LELAVAILILSVIAAVIPTIMYVAIIYWVDRYEKEPLWLLTAAFLWGAIPSIVAAFILNTLFNLPFYLIMGPGIGDAIGAVLIAPPVEETLKGLALLLILFVWRHEIDSLLDGIIYGAMVGMGFAMVENVYYFMNVYAEGGVEAWQINIFMRAIFFGLNHALFTGMTGLGIAVSRFARDPLTKYGAPVAGWMAAIFLHFVHNFAASFAAVAPILCLVLPLNAWGGVFITVVIIVWALLQEKRWLRHYLAEEVERGTLTAEQYQIAGSGIKRSFHRLNLLFSHGLRAYFTAGRFYQLCSRLAYKKHHYYLLREEESHILTERLRQEVAQLSLKLD
jgi:protease PrsW